MQEKIEPNVYTLSHKAISIIYTCYQPGQETLTYNDPANPDFSGTFTYKDMRFERTALGLLVSVYLRQQPDTNPISLTLTIPNVELAGKAKRPIETFAVITTHRYNPSRDIWGTRELYELLKLHGKALFQQ